MGAGTPARHRSFFVLGSTTIAASRAVCRSAGSAQHEFATVWQPVGPNTTLIGDDLEGFARRLKAEEDGVIAVSGPIWRRVL
jgi:hypothetical protein